MMLRGERMGGPRWIKILKISLIPFLLFGGACSSGDIFKREKYEPSIDFPGSVEGTVEFKLVDESIPEEKLADLISEARSKIKIQEGLYDRKSLSEINQALTGKLPVETEVAFQLQLDPIEKKFKAHPFLLNKKSMLTGDSLQSVKVEGATPEAYVILQFNPQGTDVFKQVTYENVGKRMAILVDGTIDIVPKIVEAVADGKVQVRFPSGDYDYQSKTAQFMTRTIQSRYHLEPEKKSWFDRMFH
jgi:hypothetical protein